MKKLFRSIVPLVLVTTLSSQLFSCGYLLHPERRGQKSGQVDWAVAGLDAIGLLFFIIPGLIAFGVDISSGTIYIPASDFKHSNLDWQKSKIVKIDPKNLNEETVAAAIKENTGVTISFDDPRLKSYRDELLEAKLASK